MLCALIRKSELVIWNVWVNPYRVHRKREEKTLLFTCVWTPKPPPPLGIVPECPTHLVTYKPSLQSESPLPALPATTFFFAAHKIFLRIQKPKKQRMRTLEVGASPNYFAEQDRYPMLVHTCIFFLSYILSILPRHYVMFSKVSPFYPS